MKNSKSERRIFSFSEIKGLALSSVIFSLSLARRPSRDISDQRPRSVRGINSPKNNSRQEQTSVFWEVEWSKMTND